MLRAIGFSNGVSPPRGEVQTNAGMHRHGFLVSRTSDYLEARMHKKFLKGREVNPRYLSHHSQEQGQTQRGMAKKAVEHKPCKLRITKDTASIVANLQLVK